MNESPESGRMSDAAVRAKTGKTWREWFALLDADGAGNMTHQEIVAVLRERHGVEAWWQQMVAVTYGQERGLRQKFQSCTGEFQASASRTIAVPVSSLFDAWVDEDLRRQWLGDEPIVIRKATPGKSVRVTWSDGKSSVEVNLWPKGEYKSQVQLQHSKLADAREVAQMKAYWGEAVDRLKQVLEVEAAG